MGVSVCTDVFQALLYFRLVVFFVYSCVLNDREGSDLIKWNVRVYVLLLFYCCIIVYTDILIQCHICRYIICNNTTCRYVSHWIHNCTLQVVIIRAVQGFGNARQTWSCSCRTIRILLHFNI